MQLMVVRDEKIIRCFLLFRIIPTILCIQLASFFSGARVEGTAIFTRTAKSVLYVSEGGNATFTWDYQVDNRITEFDNFSPKWSFYIGNTSYDIGFDNRFNNWKWEIASTCPRRLLNPTRVSKTSNATLVIFNATTADSGIYGCSLVFKLIPQPETRKSRLIVTVRPQIKITGESNVTENANVTLNCSAVGPPAPNITWINNAGLILEQGIQSAVLIIPNIKRKQNGAIYKCTATNNPNEEPVQKNITVIVKFPPENATISNYTKTCPETKVDIRCGADGNPLPTYYLYNPSNVSMGDNITGEESKMTVEPVPGNWTCYITNGVGPGIYLKAEMEVLHKKDELCVHGCTTAQKVGFVIGFIIAVVIIVVIIVVISKKKKEKRKYKEWTTLEKVLIILGAIVAIVIIIVVIVFIIKCAK